MDIIVDLIKLLQSEVPKLHGLLLPELALDWETHKELVKKLIEDAHKGGPSLDFIVCGSSTDWRDRKGNFVLVTTFSKNKAEKLIATTRRGIRPSTRRKISWAGDDVGR